MNLYLSLKDNYNFPDDKIHVLITIKDEFTPPDIFNQAIVDTPSTKADIQSVLNSFKPGGD